MSIQYIKHNQYPNFILVRNFSGLVGVEEIISSWDHLIENKLITPSIKGVINRITDCELKMDINNFKTLIDYLKNNDILKKLKLAVICKDPKKIIFPMLGQWEERKLQIKPFTTESAAVNWIMSKK